MYGADGLLDRHQNDQALNLAPAAKMNVITQITAAVRTRRGFKAGIVAEKLNEFSCVVKALAIPEIWYLHDFPLIISIVPFYLQPACQKLPVTGFPVSQRSTGN
jgi:hypothetical protein